MHDLWVTASQLLPKEDVGSLSLDVSKTWLHNWFFVHPSAEERWIFSLGLWNWKTKTLNVEIGFFSWYTWEGTEADTSFRADGCDAVWNRGRQGASPTPRLLVKSCSCFAVLDHCMILREYFKCILGEKTFHIWVDMMKGWQIIVEIQIKSFLKKWVKAPSCLECGELRRINLWCFLVCIRCSVFLVCS